MADLGNQHCIEFLQMTSVVLHFNIDPGFMDSFSAQREMCKGSTETWCGLANWVEGLPHAVQTVPVPVSSETVTIVLSLAFIHHCSLLSKH